MAGKRAPRIFGAIKEDPVIKLDVNKVVPVDKFEELIDGLVELKKNDKGTNVNNRFEDAEENFE
jgi:hypothetical protein